MDATSQMFCNVAAVVSPCVVIVEDKKHGGYCSGSVIHKTPEDTYILTQQRVIQADSMFLVHFSNKTQEYARVLVQGNAPPGTAIPGSESYFMATCHHGNTQMMVSLPVFNMSCEAYGVVVSDCRSKKRGSDSRPQKICINGTTVENELKVMLNEEDWKGALSKISKKANPRKRKYHHVQPRVKAIRP
ncbi:unnamed protein product [Urochloa humidicola]